MIQTLEVSALQPQPKESLIKSLLSSLSIKGGQTFSAFSIPLLSKEGAGEIMVREADRAGHDFSRQTFERLDDSSAEEEMKHLINFSNSYPLL